MQSRLVPAPQYEREDSACGDGLDEGAPGPGPDARSWRLRPPGGGGRQRATGRSTRKPSLPDAPADVCDRRRLLHRRRPGPASVQGGREGLARVRSTLKFEDVNGRELYKIQEKLAHGPRLDDDRAVRWRGSRQGAQRSDHPAARPLDDRRSAGGDDMSTKGNIVQHEYRIEQGRNTVATVSKKWFRVPRFLRGRHRTGTRPCPPTCHHRRHRHDDPPGPLTATHPNDRDTTMNFNYIGRLQLLVVGFGPDAEFEGLILNELEPAHRPRPDPCDRPTLRRQGRRRRAPRHRDERHRRRRGGRVRCRDRSADRYRRRLRRRPGSSRERSRPFIRPRPRAARTARRRPHARGLGRASPVRAHVGL